MAGNLVDTHGLAILLAHLSPLDVKDLVFLLSNAQARDSLKQHLHEIRTGGELWTAVQNWYGIGAAALAALHNAMVTANMSLLARRLSHVAQLPPPALQSPSAPTQLRQLLFGVAVQFPVTDVPRLWGLLGLPASAGGDAIDLMTELLCRGLVMDNGDGIERLQPLSQLNTTVSSLCSDFAVVTGRPVGGSVDGGGGALQPITGAGAAAAAPVDVGAYRLQNSICVILNVRRVPGRAERLGSERDVQRLHELFLRFRYRVIVSEEPNLPRYLALLQDVKRLLLGNGVDGLVFFVMSHGYQGHLELADGSPLHQIDHIVAQFQDGCMRNKPKIFFFQCCRGPKLQRTQLDGPSAAEALLTPSDQDNTELFVCHSTFEGFASAREVESGSWFIQTLCDQLDAPQCGNLDSLRMTVTAILNRRCGEVDGHIVNQTPALERCTLSKSVYLRPL